MKQLLLIVMCSLILFYSCDSSSGSSSSDDEISGSLTLKEIRFLEADTAAGISRILISRGTDGPGLDIQAELDDRLGGNTIASTKTYGFSEFRFVADIFLRSSTDYAIEEERGKSRLDILNWGGEADDLTKYIDLIAGKVVDDGEGRVLPRAKFDSIILQVNAPGDTIVPDFGTDDYSQTTFSWGDLKPFYSTDSSAQTILLSTYVDNPTIKWVAGSTPAIFSTLQTVLDYNAAHPDQPLSDLGDWAYNNIPMNQDFFDALEATTYTEDPTSGEAWLILPLNTAIDFSECNVDVTINFEFFLEDMMEVHTMSDASEVLMLSGTKEYTDVAGNIYYSPFPVKISCQ